MAETRIEWARTWCPHRGEWIPGFTFNPWWGCEKISPACKHCYAAALAKRYRYDVWGANAPRRLLSDDNWRKPYRWARRAREAGVRLKVFCGSMCDWAERPTDPDLLAILDELRIRLWRTIEDTQELDWLLLTKRPENAPLVLPVDWVNPPPMRSFGIPPNVWIGTTAENQEEADRRIPELRRLRARVLFVSYEPALGDVDWSAHLGAWRCRICGRRGEAPRPDRCPTGNLCASVVGGSLDPQVSWLITGAESKGSGPGRPTDPDWFRSARDQAAAAGVNFFLKQSYEGALKLSLPRLDGRQHTDMPVGLPTDMVEWRPATTGGREVMR